MKKSIVISAIMAFGTAAACSGAESSNQIIAETQTQSLKDYMEAAGYDLIHLKKLPSGHDVVNAKINGVEADFILDTGASVTIVDLAYQDDFNISGQPVEQDVSAGVGGEVLFETYTISTLSVDGHETTLNQVYVTNVNAVLSALSQFHDKPLKGIIGQDFLLGGQGVIDVAAEDLYIRTSQSQVDCVAIENCDLELDDFLGEQAYQRLSLERSPIDFMFIPVGINNDHGRFLVDSGSRETFLNMGDLEKFGITDRSKLVLGRQTVGAGGAAQTYRLNVADFNLAGLDLEIPQIGVIDMNTVESTIAAQGGGELDGVVGQDILQAYKAIIDLGDSGLFLKKMR